MLSVEADLDLMRTLSGAEFINLFGKGKFPQFSTVDDHLGQTVVTAEPGRVELAWTPTEKLCNPGGMIHGGYVAMILDNAVCFASASTLDRFIPQLTLNLNIDYLRPVAPGQTYTVIGTNAHGGRTRLVSNATIVDSRGKLLAQAGGSTLPNPAFK
ncbi:PaaI family thioesterase [Nocardia sp. NPDC127526]|uniref:PaaI family thioesterase n=1 Tax=Nocardia sp. NPDC127526 TaxID=3345393 RepID=UPI00363F2928